MSAISSLNKPISLSFSRPARAKSTEAVVGRVPRADLLPPSVVADRRTRKSVRLVGIALIGTFVVALAGIGSSFAYSASAVNALAAERATTDALLQSQTEYAEVSSALSDITDLTSARAAVGASDVDWAVYLGELNDTLPDGTVIKSVAITAATPTVGLEQASTPGEGVRAATIVLTVSSGDLSSLRAWLAALPQLTGYIDAIFQSVTEVSGVYDAEVELSLDERIYSGTYSEESATAEPAVGSSEGTEQ